MDKVARNGGLRPLYGKIFNLVLETGNIQILSQLDFDEMSVFKRAWEFDNRPVMDYLCRERWNDKYVEIVQFDDDILLDILEMYPEKYPLLEPYLVSEYAILISSKMSRHPMKLRVKTVDLK